MKFSTITLASASLALAMALAAGCSAKTEVVLTNKATDAGKDTGTTAKKDAAAPTQVDSGTGGTGGGGTTTNPDDQCPGAADCIDCCVTNHMTGYETYLTAFLGCACQTSVCKTECAATICAATPANPDAKCDACLNGTKTAVCDAPVQSACSADTDCTALMGCAQTCPE